MEQNIIEESVMMQYLLGLLPEDERSRVEETFFKNDDYFDQLTALEDEIIDDYVHDRLPDSFRIAFDEKLKTNPAWTRRTAFARALARRTANAESKAAAPSSSRAPSFWQLLTAAFKSQHAGFRLALVTGMAGALAVFLVLSWQVMQQGRNVAALRAERGSVDTSVDTMKSEIATLQAREQDLNRQLEQERLNRQNLEKEREQNVRPLGLVASFVLRAGSVRGANDQPRLLIPKSAQSVRLQLDLEAAGDYRSYRAQVRTAAGATVWTGDMLKAKTTDSGQAIVIDVPPDVLAAADYELELLGATAGGKLEEVNYYYFAVQQR